MILSRYIIVKIETKSAPGDSEKVENSIKPAKLHDYKFVCYGFRKVRERCASVPANHIDWKLGFPPILRAGPAKNG